MALFIRKLGIDLGTANTLVFMPDEGVILNEPSVVAVSIPDNKIMAVGADAKGMVGKAPDIITVYRPMKDGVLAGVTSTERRSVVEAAVRAGARAAYVIKEPILAALGAGIPIQEPTGYMIVDIGGGTTDVAVISLGGIVASTSVKVAGNKIDQAISDYVKKTYNLAVGERTSEDIKISIGSAVPVEKNESYTIKGRDLLTGLPRQATVTTNEIVKAIDYELRDMIKAIKSVLQETHPELAADIIDKGIVMTGGSSLLKNID